MVAGADKSDYLIMAPLVFDDLVITGIGISEFRVKGWVGAFRLSDGEPVWRFYRPGRGRTWRRHLGVTRTRSAVGAECG